MEAKGFRSAELRQIGCAEVDIRVPSRPLDLVALRDRLCALGLMQSLTHVGAIGVSMCSEGTGTP
eukprot:2398273-Amphidinium_carterae.2